MEVQRGGIDPRAPGYWTHLPRHHEEHTQCTREGGVSLEPAHHHTSNTQHIAHDEQLDTGGRGFPSYTETELTHRDHCALDRT